jgi:hypothetical protein
MKMMNSLKQECLMIIKNNKWAVHIKENNNNQLNKK